MTKQEHVLAVPETCINFSVFEDNWASPSVVKLNNIVERGCFLPRDKAELDETHKQLIPYCILKNNKGQVFIYQRNKKGGEKRLHAKLSLGVGGHISSEDTGTHLQIYENALAREMYEELGILRHEFHSALVGYIYDPSNSVGRVHLGCCHIISPSIYDFDLESFKIEDTIGECAFVNPSDLAADIEDFESWSQIVIRKNILCI